MLNQNQTTTAADLYQVGRAAASTAIRGKHQTNGNKKLTQMQNGKAADTITTNTADTISKAGEMRATAAALTEQAKNHRKYANQSGRTPEEVRTARATAKAIDKHAAKLTKAAAALEDSTTDRTYTDYQPIAHDAIVGRLTAERTAYVVTPTDIIKAADSLTAAVEAHQSRTPWEHMNAARSAAEIIMQTPGYLFDLAYNNALYRAATNAANRAITANLHHDSHNSTNERKTLATPEIMEAWKATHGNNSGKAYKVYTGREETNYYTMEYRKYKKQPSGWYLVYHHKTTAPNVSIEAYTEDSHGAELDIVTNGGIPMVETQEARERIAAMIDEMNLTERERDFLTYFLSTKAAHKGQAAVNAADAVKVNARRAKEAAKAAKRTAAVKQTPEAQAAARAAEQTATAAAKEAADIPNDKELIRYRGMVEAAAAHVGIQTDTAKRKFMERMRARAQAAAKVEQGCITPEEAAEADRHQWEHMQKNRRRGTAAPESVQVLFVGIDTPEAIARAAAQLAKTAKRTKNPGDIARAERAAQATKEATRAAAPVIIWRESNTAPEATNPGTDYRAAEVERRAAQQAAEAAKHREHAADLARIRAEARAATEAHRATWSARPTHAITAAAWNALPGADRITLLDTIHADGKRLEIVTA